MADVLMARSRRSWKSDAHDGRPRASSAKPVNAVPNDELLHNAVLAFVGVQRRLLVTLEASGEDVAGSCRDDRRTGPT
jgi:hypothetical protein